MAQAKVELKAGDVLGGKYRIERLIGQGGMGVVAAARHTELQQRVAIKVLPQHLAGDKDLVERFMREARAAARLRSQHAVKVVDVGTRSNGSPYIVMELLDGEDLGALVERGALPVADAVDYILQAGEAVAEAHALGIVHRDLKPRNLFLSRQLHGRPLVKVLDFGLAKRVDMQDRALTATTAVMGSPQYMSPEQMKSSRDVDFRTDIWSLGVCLYELVSTCMPFDADAVAVICAMVLKDDPRPLLSVRPDVPYALWMVIEKCLQKDPANRYTTIPELAAALEPFGSVHSQGAAARISAVAAHEPEPMSIRGGPQEKSEKSDTRTAATFDSLARAERVSSSVWWALGFSTFLFLGVVGGVLIMLSRRHAVPTREPIASPPDVAPVAARSAEEAPSDVPLPTSPSAPSSAPPPAAADAGKAPTAAKAAKVAPPAAPASASAKPKDPAASF